MLRDLYARVDRKNIYEGVGRYSKSTLTTIKERLIDSCASKSFRIMSGYFKSQDNHKLLRKNLNFIVNFLIVTQNIKLKTKYVNICQSAESNNNHFFLQAKLKKIKKN